MIFDYFSSDWFTIPKYLVSRSFKHCFLFFFTENTTAPSNATVADTLYNEIKVLCWIMTTHQNHKTKAIHVKNTWGTRCNKLIFMSDSKDDTLPTIRLKVGATRNDLVAKSYKAFDVGSSHRCLHVH